MLSGLKFSEGCRHGLLLTEGKREMKVVLLPPSFYLERSENCPKRKEVTDAAKWYSLPQVTNGGKKATFCSNTPCAAIHNQTAKRRKPQIHVELEKIHGLPFEEARSTGREWKPFSSASHSSIQHSLLPTQHLSSKTLSSALPIEPTLKPALG